MTTNDDDRPGGLKWRRRRTGPPVPYWFADQKAIKAGYPVKSANLSAYANDHHMLVERAKRLQTEMQLWLRGDADRPVHFDGTFRALLNLYETDQQSTYKALKVRTRRSYDVYLRKLHNQIGSRRIDECDGRDVLRWFSEWRSSKGLNRLPRARFVLAVLKAAVSWGVVCRRKGCAEFQKILNELRFENITSRVQAPTAEQMTAARKAAHENGAPLRALVYAIQFETTLRQEDVIGQWLPLTDKKVTDVHALGKKWVGPKWSDIGPDWVIKIKPTKTEDTTGAEVIFDLSVCPMVMEELAAIAGVAVDDLQRDILPTTGPIVVNHRTGLPYLPNAFYEGWRRDYAFAGIPKEVWNRDTRAGGISEGTKAGASKDDRRKLAGHAREETTDIYDREQLEPHRRVMRARRAHRGKNGS
jgi:hypothetical protein